jgi:hypothetical protein
VAEGLEIYLSTFAITAPELLSEQQVLVLRETGLRSGEASDNEEPEETESEEEEEPPPPPKKVAGPVIEKVKLQPKPQPNNKGKKKKKKK